MKTTISMGRKLNFFLFFAIIINFNGYSQELPCGTVMPEGFNFSKPFQMIYQEETEPPLDRQFVLKIHFWDLAEDGGQNDIVVTEYQRLKVVAELNKAFNDINIFFKYDGSSVINSSYWLEFDYNTEAHCVPYGGPCFTGFVRDNDYFLEGALNIYSPDVVENVGAYALFDYTQGIVAGVVMPFDYVDYDEFATAWQHEVGHFFGLFHTFESCGGNCIENVAREEEINFNADTAGDDIIDTYATKTYYNITDCLYDDTQLDPTGRPYVDYPPQADNFMSYAPDECRAVFTSDQIAEMRAFIDWFEEHPDGITFINNYHVSILYEPYKGIYYNSGPMTHDHHPFFQPGFDYKFVDTSQAAVYNQPSDYEDTSFWYGQPVAYYPSSYDQPIEHFNHSAFYIVQLGDETYRKCYNNANRSASFGNLIYFEDGYPNGNYTVTPKDSTQINSPTLINELDPGLYNVQKTYNDGTEEQVMILKDNQ